MSAPGTTLAAGVLTSPQPARALKRIFGKPEDAEREILDHEGSGPHGLRDTRGGGGGSEPRRRPAFPRGGAVREAAVRRPVPDRLVLLHPGLDRIVEIDARHWPVLRAMHEASDPERLGGAPADRPPRRRPHAALHLGAGDLSAPGGGPAPKPTVS